MYLGKWHGCDAAVKCLNPGLFFGGGDVNNHAAVADLLKEADMLGGCACADPRICCCTPDVRIRRCRGLSCISVSDKAVKVVIAITGARESSAPVGVHTV